MPTVQLTKGFQALIDDADLSLVTPWSWYALGRGGHLYAARKPRSGILLMHRVIMNAPAGVEVDHINGDGLDNRRVNLRLVTHSQNARNQKPRLGCSSRFKGVSWDRVNRCWEASIKKDYRKIRLGRFTDELEAARAYNVAALGLFGPYARLNDLENN